jgi:hypothetical protein
VAAVATTIQLTGLTPIWNNNVQSSNQTSNRLARVFWTQ